MIGFTFLSPTSINTVHMSCYLTSDSVAWTWHWNLNNKTNGLRRLRCKHSGGNFRGQFPQYILNWRKSRLGQFVKNKIYLVKKLLSLNIMITFWFEVHRFELKSKNHLWWQKYIFTSEKLGLTSFRSPCSHSPSFSWISILLCLLFSNVLCFSWNNRTPLWLLFPLPAYVLPFNW